MQAAKVVQQSLSVARGHYRAGLSTWINVVICWRPLLDHLLLQQAAAISRPQAFGKMTLETRLVSCAPWNVAYRPRR